MNDNNLYQQAPMAQPKPSFGKAISSFFSNFAKFKGRARRSEYWYAVLFLFLVSIALMVVVAVLLNNVPRFDFTNHQIIDRIKPVFWILTIFSLVLSFPLLSLSVRRLHDIGWSGAVAYIEYVFYLIIMAFGIFAFCTLMNAPVHGYYVDQYSNVVVQGYSNYIPEEWWKGNVDTLVVCLVVCVLASILMAVFALILFVCSLINSQKGANRFGPSPKYPNMPPASASTPASVTNYPMQDNRGST